MKKLYLNFGKNMIDKIKQLLETLSSNENQPIAISEEELIEQLLGGNPNQDPELRVIGLLIL